MTIEVVAHFNKKDKVPDWFISIEPYDTTKPFNKGEITFQIDCYIVKTNAGYIIVPNEDHDEEAILIENMINMHFYTPLSCIKIPSRYITMNKLTSEIE